MPVMALGLDTSVDDEIRRNYNPEKIEQDLALPVLPKILNESKSQTIPISELKVQAKPSQYKQVASANLKENYAIIKKGTKIRVKILGGVSDKTRKGTQLSFISRYPVSTTYFTIPTGTMFKGEVIQSHRPQLSANGGLIVIKVNSVILNNQVHPIEASITKAGSKKIFLNNIKGNRKYLSSMFKSVKPSINFFTKMLALSGNLARDGSSIVIAPFSLAFGIVALGGNIAIAPALALFYKGDSIYIHDGGNFEIKLLQDVFIR